MAGGMDVRSPELVVLGRIDLKRISLVVRTLALCPRSRAFYIIKYLLPFWESSK